MEYTSAHPPQTFSSLIKGELTRLLRACSNQGTFDKVIDKMTTIFRDRGYPKSLITRMVQTVPYSVRPQVLSPTNRPPCDYDTFLVTHYTKDLDIKQLRGILKPTLSEQAHVPKPCLSLKKTNNFKNYLVRAKLKHSTDPPMSQTELRIPVTPNLEGHSAGCATSGCKCCRAMSRKLRVHSSSSLKSFPTPKHTNCNSICVIYLLECSKCTKQYQYVGQTQRMLSQRLAGHRAASSIKINLPLYKHFRTHAGHNFERDAKMTILEQTTKTLLNAREGHWIKTLDTVYPKGLNSRYE